MKKNPYNPLVWLASLRLTIVLLAMGIFLIFAGTLAQVEQGIWVVVRDYFRSLVVWIPLDVFRPILWPGSDKAWPGGFYFVGGFLLLGLLVVNLVAAHAMRYKITARGQKLAVGWGLTLVAGALMALTVAVPVLSRAIQQDVLLMLAIWTLPMVVASAGVMLLFGGRKAGIVLIHVGLILLLLGEFVTGLSAHEGQMFIPERGSSNVIRDIREPELAFVTPTENGKERHVVIPRDLLRKAVKTGQPIEHAELPVRVRVDAYMPNSDLAVTAARSSDPGSLNWQASEIDTVSGTQVGGSVDFPSAYITLLDGERSLGQFLVSTYDVISPKSVELGGRPYTIEMRFRRTYLPYSIQLHNFSNDTFTGTTVARNYSSDLRLIDEQGLAREAFIKMNQPLRYDGKAFFQSGFFQPPLPANTGTILQVVENPGSWIPYMSCVIVTVGLCMQFGASLIRYGKRAAVKGVG